MLSDNICFCIHTMKHSRNLLFTSYLSISDKQLPNIHLLKNAYKRYKYTKLRTSGMMPGVKATHNISVFTQAIIRTFLPTAMSHFCSALLIYIYIYIFNSKNAYFFLYISMFVYCLFFCYF